MRKLIQTVKCTPRIRIYPFNWQMLRRAFFPNHTDGRYNGYAGRYYFSHYTFLASLVRLICPRYVLVIFTKIYRARAQKQATALVIKNNNGGRGDPRGDITAGTFIKI